MTRLPAPLPEDAVAEHVSKVARDGYTILHNAVDADFLDEIYREIDRLEQVRPGGDIPPAPFTGQVTRRWFDLLNDGDIWQDVAVHPWVMQVQQQVLGDGFLLSTMGTAVVGPGEVAQPIHVDDALYGFPRPHPTIVCNTMWAVSDFTEETGATRIIPSSHKWAEDPDFTGTYESIPAEMSPGSICMFVGSLYHGAGQNVSNGDRYGLTINYCSGAMRQQENLMLGISPQRMMSFSTELQDLIGFKMYGGAGHIFAQDPRTEMQRHFGEDDSDDPWLARRNDLHRDRTQPTS
nr:phytanoyl-CoA dioxygenase family protein [Hyphomonas sp. Mor2]